MMRAASVMMRVASVASALCFLLAGCGGRQGSDRMAFASGITASPAPTASVTAKPPRPDHVIVVVEENHAFSGIIGNGRAPYLNQLAQRGAVFTESYGVAHPSAPNYVALFSGQTNNNCDSCPERGVPRDAPNLGGLLLAHGFSFVGYSETMPRTGFTGCFAGFTKWSYARKHNPWVNFTSVPPSSNQPLKLPAFDQLPTVAFIIPNQAHDMHSGSIEDADEWLKAHVGPIIDWGMTHNSLTIITWDEDDREESKHIPTCFVGPMVKPGHYDTRIDHCNVLRTLEDLYGLPPAGRAA